MSSVKALMIWMTLATCSHAAGGWDDFANNLATDLAPIMQLFGEQVTLQYLSESTSFLDSIVFAMAPLGVLTAIVSVIRVCGHPLLEAFIGRAQEGPRVAEVALCSSTGRDIAELHQNGVIVRVFGQPKLLEIVHDPQGNDFYPGPPAESLNHVGCTADDHLRIPTSAGRTTEPTAGLRIFDDFYKTRRSQDEWHRSEDNGDAETGYPASVLNPPIALNPNLRLNLGIKKPPRWLLLTFAIFGVVLQSSVIAFAIWVTKIARLLNEDSAHHPRLYQ